METILVQINNPKAYKLLQDLESLELIKMIKKSITPKEKLSEKFAGKLNLSKKEYDSFQEYITNSRNEWDR